MSRSESPRLSTFEALLHTVFALHEEGAFDEAEPLYRELIDRGPSIWQLHFNYGLLLYERGRYEEALTAYRRGLALDDANPDLLYNLALCQKKIGSRQEAVNSYQKVLLIEPDDAATMYNLAGCYREMDNDEQAMVWYEKVLLVDPAHRSALTNLAFLHHKKGNLEQAATRYRKILDLSPDNELADHLLASIEGMQRNTVPDGYIRDVFNQFSDHYEQSLTDTLEYRLPAALLQFMRQWSANSSFGRLLDLGCGTGLAGEALRPHCDTLIGVDISEDMVELARRKSIYDSLHVQGISEFLEHCETARYDCVVAADVVPYVGELANLFARLPRSLADDGRFFFSAERLEDQNPVFRLQPSGRFAHTCSYIEGLSRTFGWQVMASETLNLRKEKDDWIVGTMFALKRADHGAKHVDRPTGTGRFSGRSSR
ncbi:MAG: tetratricopeptide repeat protein [Desulfofustis sp.]|nr:tetratricopeptide repeat protein [Desulfofustis sp.]